MQRPIINIIAASWLAGVVTACGSSTEQNHEGVASSPGSLDIAVNSVTSFDATYHLGGGWARAHVEYTPATTFFEVSTSQGTSVVHDGTALDGRQSPAGAPDPRSVDGVVRLGAGDPEYPLVSGLLDALERAGATAFPTRSVAGTTM